MPKLPPIADETRRSFLRKAGGAVLGVAGTSGLASKAGAAPIGPPAHIVRDDIDANAWRSRLVDQVTAKKAQARASQYQPSVRALADLMDSDSLVRMYVTQMIDQVPTEKKKITSPDDLLAALDHIVQTAPAYNSDPKLRNTFPVSNLFVDMMFTPAGAAGFRNRALNDAIRGILKAWCDYLDSPASRNVLNTGAEGWLSPSAYALNKLDEFVIPDKEADHWGFPSFNAYFHREIKSKVRPIASPGNDKVIVSANDGTVYRIARKVARSDSFWLKSQPYSLADMLDNHPTVDDFVGGDIFQSFLSGADYHRWRAPISGEITDTRIVDGLMFSELLAEGYDSTAGTYSQGYQATVNTRALVFIKSDDVAIGTVCVMPIGITEISSITITAKKGQRVLKGDELGYFSYGGSILCLVFQPGAIKSFSVSQPGAGSNPDSGPPIKVNAELAIAND